ncbi:MAG: NAD(P)/FAD-dependent oxidoreductase [Flavobacteriaceae bacterium]
MLSYWEQSAMLDYDLVVLGGGITGMFCALSYRERYPKARIAILERGLFSSGASTKNAGFACFGSLSELIDDTQHMEAQALLDLVQLRMEGLTLLKKTLGESEIGFQSLGGYELFFEENPEAIKKIEEINTLLYPLFGQAVFQLNNSKIESFGFSKKQVHHLIENPFEGQLNSGKMMRALRLKVNSCEIDYMTLTEVNGFDLSKSKPKIAVQLKDQNIEINTHKLAVCTNAFSKQFFPKLRLNPGRGLVVLTHPIEGLKVKGAFHYKEGYYYFRNIDNRILFGGGRELDFKGETTTEFGSNSKIKQQLMEDLSNIILPDQPFSIDMEWSGIMAFGKNKTPLVEKIDSNIALGVRLGGMGIAIGSKIGEATAKLLFD